MVGGLALSSALILSTTPLTSVSAETSMDQGNESQEQNAETDQEGISSELQDKVDPYISLEDEQFEISDEGLEKLSESEKETVLSSIHEMNEVIKENDETGTVTQKGNTLEQEVSGGEAKSQSKAQTQAASGAVSVSYKWWGTQIHFSHAAVNALSDYFAISGIAGGLGAQEAVKDFLAKRGLSLTSKALGPIALYGSGISWAMGKVDKGNGVNLNLVLEVPATITAR